MTDRPPTHLSPIYPSQHPQCSGYLNKIGYILKLTSTVSCSTMAEKEEKESPGKRGREEETEGTPEGM